MTKEWFKRSQKYANLKWTKDESLLEAVRKECKLNKHSVVCDIGTGTGLVANHLRPYCKSVDAIDTSHDMLARASYNYPKDIYYHLMDAENMNSAANSFASNIFDCVVSRMAFHHIENLQKAMTECNRILKKGGRMVICEGIPPVGCYEFHRRLFRLTEKRHNFRGMNIINLFEFYGFKNITYKLHTLKQLSNRNWLNNLNLNEFTKKYLFDMWKNAPPYIKKGHNVTLANGDILLDWLYIIVSGVK